jgi:hypothetical protein
MRRTILPYSAYFYFTFPLSSVSIKPRRACMKVICFCKYLHLPSSHFLLLNHAQCNVTLCSFLYNTPESIILLTWLDHVQLKRKISTGRFPIDVGRNAVFVTYRHKTEANVRHGRTQQDRPTLKGGICKPVFLLRMTLVSCLQQKDTCHKYNQVRKQHTHTHILALVRFLRVSHGACCTRHNQP